MTRAEPSRVRPRGRFRRLTALVGRGELLKKAEQQINSWLRQSYDPATFDITTGAAQINGRNRLLVVGGAAAVGKSRFAYELVERMKAQSTINIAYAHCVENGSLSAFAAEVAGVAGLTKGNLPARWEELCSHAAQPVSAQYAERQRKHLPLLALLLDCEEVDTAGIRQADTASFLLGVKLALRACCELVAHFTSQPVMLVIEDLQWMGSLREVITDLLANACLPQPLIAIGTARPEFAATDEELAELTGIGEAGLSAGLRPFSVMELPPLERTEGGRLVQKLLPGIKLPGQVERELAEKADGLPYYYEEFARLLVRHGLVVEREGSFEVKEGVSEVELPEDIRALILDRLNGLEPELRELTGRAAVIGRSFSRKRLQEIEKRLGVGTAERLETGLADLAEQQVLGGEPGDQYFFEHVMSRDAAYNSVPNPDRLLLHGVMSDVLSEMLVPGTASEWDILPELAKHLESAGNHREAHEKCCKLLGLMAKTGRIDQWKYWEEKARHAWEHARSTALALPEKSPYSLQAIGTRRLHQGRYKEAEKLLKESLAIHREIGDHRGVGLCLNNLGVVAEQQRRNEEAAKYHHESLEIYREIGDRKGTAGNLHNLGNVTFNQGRYEDGEKLYREALEINREIGNRLWIAYNLNSLGGLAHAQGRYEEGKKLYEESLAILREIGDRCGIAASLNSLGAVACCERRYNEGEKLCREALEIRREIGDRRGIASSLNNLAEVGINLEHLGKACKCLVEALRIVGEIGSPNIAIEKLTTTGYFLSKTNRLNESALLLAGAEHHAKQIGHKLALMEQTMLDERLEKLSEGLPVEELAEAKARAEIMSLEELVEFALKALESLSPEELSGAERDSGNG